MSAALHSSIARPAALALALALSAGAAQAHDTWFDVRGQRGAGDLFMALGTGNLYPVFEYPIGAEHLQRRGCRTAGQPSELTPVANASTSLLLKTRLAGNGPASCWAQLLPAEIELKPDIVAVYFEEARPSAAVRAAWAAMQARGLLWKERYTKHARIVFNADTAGGTVPGPAADPGDMGLDLVLQGNGRVLRAGDSADVQVLRDGRPLPGLEVELRRRDDASTSTGIWLQADAEGRVRLALPTAGKWLLRGIEIRPSPTVPDSWDSRFATLAFDVAPPAGR